jgi:hypothetical protein
MTLMLNKSLNGLSDTFCPIYPSHAKKTNYIFRLKKVMNYSKFTDAVFIMKNRLTKELRIENSFKAIKTSLAKSLLTNQS